MLTRRDEEDEGGREFAQSEGGRGEEGVVGRGIMLNKPTWKDGRHFESILESLCSLRIFYVSLFQRNHHPPVDHPPHSLSSISSLSTFLFPFFSSPIPLSFCSGENVHPPWRGGKRVVAPSKMEVIYAALGGTLHHRNHPLSPRFSTPPSPSFVR